jgi:stage V sporulation protein AB
MEWIGGICAAIVGFSGGIAVGGGMVALLVVLDIIPRLAQMTRSPYSRHRFFESAVIFGVLFATLADFLGWGIRTVPLAAAAVGLFSGLFVGMLAGALTEVLNVLPIMAKRLGLKDAIVWLVMAMALGKVAGSLFDWLVYQQQ